MFSKRKKWKQQRNVVNPQLTNHFVLNFISSFSHFRLAYCLDGFVFTSMQSIRFVSLKWLYRIWISLLRQMNERASDWIWLKRIIFSFCDAWYYFRSFAFTIFIREHRRIAVFSIEVFLFLLISTSYFRPYHECVTFWQYAILTCTRTVSYFFAISLSTAE